MKFYNVTCTIAPNIQAESPEDAARMFARLLEDGDLYLSDVADRGEDDETLAKVSVSEQTADGQRITYYVEVDDRIANVRSVLEDRPLRLSEGDADA